MAKILIGVGVLLVIIGVIWLLFPNAFSWGSGVFRVRNNEKCPSKQFLA